MATTVAACSSSLVPKQSGFACAQDSQLLRLFFKYDPLGFKAQAHMQPTQTHEMPATFQQLITRSKGSSLALNNP